MSRVLFLACLPVVAQASPFDLAHSGRVLDAQGAPVSGVHAVELTLFDVDSGSEIWSDDYANVEVSQGYYSVTLTGLDTQWFGRSVELEVAVGGTTMGERSPLVSVPHALVAASIPAGAVASGTCDSAGQMFYDTSTNSVLACNGTEWFAVGRDATDLELDSSGRRWADNTFASTCNEYKNPPDGYAYSGATGSGVYQIDPGADGTPESVYCDMVFDGGGWTLVFHSTYTGNNQADPGIDVNMATRRTVTIGSPDSYTGVGTAGFYFLAMNDFKGVGDDSTALRFESDNFQDHTTLQDLSVTATYGLDGSNESQIRTEMCGGNNNCFIDAPGLSTTDVRQDNHSQFCLPSYYDQAWWYDNCFSYNPTWTSGVSHFSGYSSKDASTQHWSWWMR